MYMVYMYVILYIPFIKNVVNDENKNSFDNF